MVNSGDVWGHRAVGYGVLCFEGKKGVCTAGENCEAGCLGGSLFDEYFLP